MPYYPGTFVVLEAYLEYVQWLSITTTVYYYLSLAAVIPCSNSSCYMDVVFAECSLHFFSFQGTRIVTFFVIHDLARVYYVT